jgi:hypothetical protein
VLQCSMEAGMGAVLCKGAGIHFEMKKPSAKVR